MPTLNPFPRAIIYRQFIINIIGNKESSTYIPLITDVKNKLTYKF
jgi:hypothetical protein